MRWLGSFAVLLCGTAIAVAKPSNPAFLGIGMRDLTQPTASGTAVRTGPCLVESVTRGSGAKHAGLQPGDVIVTIDGVQVPTCDAVQKVVQARGPGDTVPIQVSRYGRPVSLTATLLSRDEILRRRHVGYPIGATDVFVLDEHRTYDLGALRGKTTIVGWFDRRCDGCKTVFTRIAEWTRSQGDASKLAAPLVPIAVTAGDPDAKTSPIAGTLDVPLAIATPALYEEFTIPDAERIHFMVVDGRGIVQYVTPVAPNGEDTEAVLDELFAAAEQASRRATR